MSLTPTPEWPSTRVHLPAALGGPTARQGDVMHRETIQLRQTRYAPLERGERVDQAESKRECAAPGCATMLSRYNPSETCASHRGWQDLRERQHA